MFYIWNVTTSQKLSIQLDNYPSPSYPRIRAPADKPKVYKVSIYSTNYMAGLVRFFPLPPSKNATFC